MRPREIHSVTIRVKRDASSEGIPLPSYATAEAAGVDLRASADTTLAPGEYKAIGTGIFLEIPAGYEGQVRPRSGLALKHGITLLNAPGTIDSDYRGEIRVILINHGSERFQIKRGDRIAQIVFAPVVRASLFETAEITQTDRGTSGFGSTGTE